jgi:hypothetical protein
MRAFEEGLMRIWLLENDVCSQRMHGLVFSEQMPCPL